MYQIESKTDASISEEIDDRNVERTSETLLKSTGYDFNEEYGLIFGE